ncbi:MAG: XdhC/CoxI family protein [Acidimicrobiales bacterium]|jgi:xanthine dehydrogenase accessory factor
MSREIFDLWVDAINSDEPICLITVIAGQGLGAKMLVRPAKSPVGTLGHGELDRVVERDALAELEVGRSGVRSYGAQGQQRENDLTVFVESQASAPRMLIFGAVDFTAALASAAKLLGYRVVVADARPVFATRKRFPMADELRVSWPDEVFDEFGPDLGPRDAVAVLTHDNKFDVPAVVRALETRVGYIGVMGSRKTHDGRTRRLREAGVDNQGLARLRSPIGIDIGGRTPEETAVSICAEIIALRSGRRVSALSDTDGPIHER